MLPTLLADSFPGFPGELTIYRLTLNTQAPPTKDITELLSPSEQIKMRRYRFVADQVRYAATRAWLRTLLAKRLQVAPADIAFQKGQWGKPFLPPQSLNGMHLPFNTSHSGDIALIAIATTAQPLCLGVDVEHHRPDLEWPSLQDDVLTAAEQQTVSLSTKPLESFYLHWVAKEASLKAIGCGISEHLKNLFVQIDKGEHCKVKSVVSSLAEHPALHLQTLPMAPDYTAAIAWCEA